MIYYFEVEFSDSTKENAPMTICIKADYDARCKEIEEFCKEDMINLGFDHISLISTITEEEAYGSYDMERENIPILKRDVNKLKTFKIPVSWEMCGFVYVDAEDLEEACSIAEEDETIELPDAMNSDYVDASWRVDWESALYYNEGK